MTNISGVHNVAVPAVSSVSQVTPAANALPTQAAQAMDTVELSTIARLAAKIQELPEVRTELVQRIKAELASGTYESSDKIDVAVDRLMDELLN
jgi:anti-sigma28 factor (negative regulator of flagellin synthesis)